MKRTYDQLEGMNVCEQKNPAAILAERTAAEKHSPDQELWDFGEHKRERLSSDGHRAASFAHEVANSLALISCSIQFVNTELQTNRINDPLLNKVIASALREIDGVGSLLQEYCTLNHSQSVNLEITDLAKLVKDVLALQNLVCQASGISVTFEPENAVLWVRLDARKIRQVITNLCKNAREAMPRGGRLTIKLYRSERLVVLEVSDSGVGVPEGIDVFELFKTTKPAGRGLGLPLVREIVAAHRGSITFTSAPDRGTTFRISLPSPEQALERDRPSDGIS